MQKHYYGSQQELERLVYFKNRFNTEIWRIYRSRMHLQTYALFRILCWRYICRAITLVVDISPKMKSILKCGKFWIFGLGLRNCVTQFPELPVQILHTTCVQKTSPKLPDFSSSEESDSGFQWHLHQHFHTQGAFNPQKLKVQEWDWRTKLLFVGKFNTIQHKKQEKIWRRKKKD